MSDDNSMDVNDPKATLLPSLMPLPPLSLGVGEFRKLMIDASKTSHWSDRITDAGSDKEKLRFVLNFALSVCGSIASTVTKYQKPAEAIVDPRTRQKQASFFFICRFFTYAPYTPSLENIQSRVAQLIRLTIDSFRKDSARHTSKSSLEILPQSSSIISNRLILPTGNWRIYRSTLKLSPWFKVPEQANHAC